MIDYQVFVKNGDAFFEFLNKKFDIKNILHRYPIRADFDGRLVESELDFFIEISKSNGQNTFHTEGAALILNNDFSGDYKKIKGEASRCALKMAWLKKAVAKMYQPHDMPTLDMPIKIETYVHFLMQGVLIKLDV